MWTIQITTHRYVYQRHFPAADRPDYMSFVCSSEVLDDHILTQLRTTTFYYKYHVRINVKTYFHVHMNLYKQTSMYIHTIHASHLKITPLDTRILVRNPCAWCGWGPCFSRRISSIWAVGSLPKTQSLHSAARLGRWICIVVRIWHHPVAPHVVFSCFLQRLYVFIPKS